MKRLWTLLTLSGLMSIFLGTTVTASVPKLINYQGMLTDEVGNPSTGNYDMIFRIYNAASGGDLRWEETHNGVSVINGLFNVILGSVDPDGLDLDFSEEYWLDITVGGEHMPTRLRFTSVGYAYRAEKADTAHYALSSPSGPENHTWTFRITDTADTTISTGGSWGIARYGNTLYGNTDSTHVNLGVACTTGTSGQNHKYCTVGGGRENTASERYATVGGGRENTASGYIATVGGGNSNTASGDYATVGGGTGNSADANYATVGGGRWNHASGRYATVGGGYWSTASGELSFAAGYRAKANHTGAFVWADVTNEDFASTDTNQFLIRASGGVGIGTNSPEEMLHVQNATEGVIKVGTPTANGNATVIFEEGNDDAMALRYDGSTNELRIDDETKANTRMVIERSGNVGIGTTAPLTTAHIRGSSLSLPSEAIHYDEFILEDGDAILGLYSGTAGPAGSAITFGEIAGGALAEKWAIIRETTGGGKGLRITYGTGKDQFVNPTMMYLDSLGNVGIGTDDPGTKLAVSGLTGTSSYNNVKVNTATGDFYYQSSSERYKEDIRPLEDDFEKILEAQPRSFGDKASGQREIGYIAEEFDEMGLSNLVIYDSEGQPDGLKYELISLYLLEVVKEFKVEKEELKQRIEALEER